MQGQMSLRWACLVPMLDVATTNTYRVPVWLDAPLMVSRETYAACILVVVLYPFAAKLWRPTIYAAVFFGVLWFAIVGSYRAENIPLAMGLLGLGLAAEPVLVAWVASTHGPGIVRRILWATVFGGVTEIVCFTLGELSRKTWSAPDAVSIIAQTYGPWASSVQLSAIMLAYLYAVGWSGADGR